jgi:hypothetical protein
MRYDIDGKSFKEKYDLFCSKVYVPIFSQPWWMDAVCGPENWDVLVVEEGGWYNAAMPYFLTERDGKTLITKAKLTQNNGVIFHYPPDQKYNSRLDFEERTINKICDYIETLGLDKYEQQYHYSVTNWLPFRWRGYSEMTRYTYVIEDTSDMQKIENDFSSELRRNIRKAERLVQIGEDLPIEDIYRVNKMTFDRQNMQMPYSFEFLKHLDEACRAHQCCKSFYAYDENHTIYSIVYIIWDQESVYYIVGGTDPAYKSSQASVLLLRESIRFASRLGLKYDFEGSVIQPIEKAFRSFGGIQKPYFRIYKEF